MTQHTPQTLMPRGGFRVACAPGPDDQSHQDWFKVEQSEARPPQVHWPAAPGHSDHRDVCDPRQSAIGSEGCVQPRPSSQ